MSRTRTYCQRLPLSQRLYSTTVPSFSQHHGLFKQEIAGLDETPESVANTGFLTNSSVEKEFLQICAIQACWCVLVQVGQLNIPFLMDTGASVNILATSTYD